MKFNLQNKAMQFNQDVQTTWEYANWSIMEFA